MRTAVDVHDDLLDRARRELGTTTKKDTIHEALRLVADCRADLEAVQALIAIDRDWGRNRRRRQGSRERAERGVSIPPNLYLIHLSLGPDADSRRRRTTHGNPARRCRGNVPAAGPRGRPERSNLPGRRIDPRPALPGDHRPARNRHGRDPIARSSHRPGDPLWTCWERPAGPMI
jgi:Arc/MetJ family transcription regulator